MSGERKEPNATWQDPNGKNWENANEDEMASLSQEQDQIEAQIDPSAAIPQDDSELEELIEPQLETFFTRFEPLWQFVQQISPILIPLLFAGLTFLIILPMALGGHIYLHADHLWPTALVLLALALLQGMLLYYAGSNNVYWTLAVIGGFLLFLLVGCFALFGPLPTVILFVVLAIASIVALRYYMHPVREGYVDIVYSFGKYKRTLYPGLNFLLPWEWVDSQLHTHERQWTCPEQAVQVSRDEDVHLKATIAYQLMPEDAYLAITQPEEWEKSLQDMFIACLQSVCHQLTPNDFINWPERSRSRQAGNMILNNPAGEDEAHWERINTSLYEQMRDRVAPWGVVINWAQIRDITLTPRFSTKYDTGPMASMGAEAASKQAPSTPEDSRRMGPDTSRRATAAPPVPPAKPGVSATMNPPEESAEAVAAAAAAAKIPNEKVLRDAYEQIKNGKVTSPEVIRKVASGFQAIANDPEASNNVSFDAARAAQTLYERANFYEGQASVPTVTAHYSEDDTPTQVDWSYRHPKDDNYTAGG